MPPVPLHLVLRITLSCVFFGGCSGWPQARLDSYLGLQPELEANLSGIVELPKGPIRTGLWVLNDTTALDSATPLLEASLVALTEHVQHQLMHAVPIEVAHVTSASTPAVRAPNFTAILQWGKEQRVDYLVIVVLSSTEIEVPERFPWRGSTPGAIGRGLLLGYRAENLALAELALVDVSAGHVLIRVAGYAWASLDRLDVPLASNVYPVVRRNLEDPPIYPNEEENAHDVMRAVAGHDAMNQAVMHLKEAWDRAKRPFQEP